MNQNKPMVSVIIAVYNGQEYISKAIGSVLGQSYREVEIIVVDDGSTDQTKSILEPLIASGKIVYIYQANKGLASARNAGIEKSKGEYLKFLDCDDILYPDMLQKQVDHLKRKPSYILSVSDYELEFESKKKITVQLFLKEDQLAHFIEGNPCPVHTVLVHRDMVKTTGGFDDLLRSHEDTDLWIRILLNGGIFEHINYVGCCYRLLSGALSANSKQMFLSQYQFSEKLNKALMPRFEQMTTEVLKQLYFANTQIIHKAFVKDINPSQNLKITLKSLARLHGMKAGFAEKLALIILGTERWARKGYKKACLIDPRYPLKLMDTPWRNEGFYQRQYPTYWEFEPRNKKIKNILYVNSSSVIYGAETRLLDILNNLDRSKYHPYVLLPHHGPLTDRLKEMGIITLHLEYGFPLKGFNKANMQRYLDLNRNFVRLVRKCDIDVIHANLHINLSKFWLGLIMLRLPLIIHMRSHFWLGSLEKIMVSLSYKAIFISKFVEREFLKKRRFDFLFDRRANQSIILHDGIDIHRFCPRPNQNRIRKELNIGSKVFIVGIIGAVDKVKGQDLLIEAANLVVPKHPNVKIVIVGDLYHSGEKNLAFRELLLRKIEEYNLKSNVIFTGFRYDIEVFMNEIDLLVQPSEREALGTSMVEAMSSGKPVIGSDVDGIPEVIGSNEGGILLNPRTPEAFAKAINYFIENPEEAKKTGERGRQRVLDLFNVNKNIKIIEQIYQEALEKQW